MGKNDEREAFRQAALKMAKYRLRKVMNDAGCTPQEIREAEVEGEDRMIDIIMTKYDEGAIDLPGLEKAKGGGGGGNSTPAKEEPKKEEPRKAKREEKKQEKKQEKNDDDDDDDDPYSSAFDDDDEDGPHGGGDDDDEVNEEAKAQDDVENHEADPPRKAGRKAQRTEEPASDLSAVEEKLDKLLDVTVSSIETSLETRAVLDKHVAESNLFYEIVKMAFARIWKLGAANPLKPGFGDVIKKARSILGLPEEEQKGD